MGDLDNDRYVAPGGAAQGRARARPTFIQEIRYAVLTLTEGVLPRGSEEATFTRLCQAMLKWHGLTGNRALTPNVIGSIRVLPRGETFSGLQAGPIAVVEWIVPSFAFASREIQLGYVAEATEIVFDASGKRHPKERIWCAVLHAVDDTWGIGGQAFTNAELAQQVSQG